MRKIIVAAATQRAGNMGIINKDSVEVMRSCSHDGSIYCANPIFSSEWRAKRGKLRH